MSDAGSQTMTIFGQALECASAEERETFLDRACGGDAQLRAKVHELLQAHQDAGNFLRGNSTPVDAGEAKAKPSHILVGAQIGPYRLTEQIGEGGMGLVFVAEQRQPVQRQVALKVIKPGMGTREVVARFEGERQALALMDHPHIARVFDGGATESGQPYFVMELVRGVPISDYCDQAGLTLRERVKLFVNVCQAVQHAHQKGIIHRDLKPSNVLVTRVDGRPAAKVIDFGVAKAIGQQLTDHTLHTRFMQMLGTPLYMSPEQAAMGTVDVDTRSDIYSLGVLLYELLTGTTPFEKDRLKQADFDEMRRIIREEEPPRPSARVSTLAGAGTTIAAQCRSSPRRLGEQLRGELDWIVMKCLEKDRNRRYETVSALVLDLDRYLADEPVLARPPSALYRFRKFARRNALPLVAGTLVALAMLAGTAISTWQAVRATEALHAEEAEHNRANDNLGRANDAVEKFLAHVTEDPRLQQANLHELRRNLLASALPFYEEFVKQKQDDPDLKWNRGRAFRGLGLVHQALGEHKAALRDTDQARAIFAELVEAYPNEPRYRQHLGFALSDLGNQLRETGQHAEAAQAFRDGLAIRQRLVADFPLQPEYQIDLAGVHGNLGVLFMLQEKAAEAATEFRQAIKILEPIGTGPSAPLKARRPLGMSHINLGFALYKQGDLEAEAELRAGLAIFADLASELAADPSYQRQVASAHNHLGNFYRDTKHPEKAAAAFTEAQKVYEPLAENFPTVPNYRSELGGVLNNLAMLRINENRLAEAEPLLVRAIANQRAALKANPKSPHYREFLSNHYAVLADAQVRQGQHRTATESAVAMSGVRPEHAEDAYDAGCLFARCVPLAQADQKIAEAQRLMLAQQYGDQAMMWLRAAIARGYNDVEHMKTDDDLTSLRQRPDFQKLLAELEAKRKQSGGR